MRSCGKNYVNLCDPKKEERESERENIERKRQEKRKKKPRELSLTKQGDNKHFQVDQ